MPISIGKLFSRIKDINDHLMGGSYTSISTQDPNDVLLSQEMDRIPTSYSMSFLEKKTYLATPIHNGTVSCLAPVRPGMVISGGSDSVISLNNIDTGECALKWLGHANEITKVAYKHTAGKHYVLSGSRDATLKLWQFNKQTTEQTFQGHNLSITGLALLEDNKIISGSRDTTLRLWDINTAKTIYHVEKSRNLVTHISSCISENKIAQSSEDKEIKIWDTRNIELISTMPKKNHIQTHVDISSDGIFCLSSSNGFNGDGCEITLWDLRTNKILREFKGHEATVSSAVFLPQQITWKRLMLSTSAMGIVKIWNVDDGNCVWTEEVPVKCDLMAGVGFNDGNIIVSGTNSVLCHMRLLGRAGRPYLKTISIQTDSKPTN
uniref:WD_REPEATS_REGION domain-containing protein n=1 Tax=Parastrongyloides trichosuri TaxID=131310 RepID=A0A0N4ZHE6_PARTI